MSSPKDTNFLRLALLLAGGIYFSWWFATLFLFPEAFNPLGSRLAVVALILATLAASFLFQLVRKYLRAGLIACVWVLTLHFFYLFYGNHGDPDWVIGSFVTVLGTCFIFSTSPQLFAYSLFVIALALALALAMPPLRHTVFLPGLVTILIQANLWIIGRARALHQLHESNDRFQLLFNSTTEGVLLHERGRITSVNDAFCELLGLKREGLLGRSIFELAEPHSAAAIRKSLEEASPKPFELTVLRHDGKPIELEARAKEVVDDGRTIRLVTLRDLSDRKRAEEERLTARAMAERVRALDEFLALASHELKTPVTSMKLWMQLLERQAKGIGRVAEIASLVGSQINRLAALIETMLDTSQVSTGTITLQRSRVDFAELVRQLLEAFRPEAERAQTPFQFTAPGPLFVQGDSARLAQVVSNLLSNGIKYGNRRPVFVSLTAEGREVVLRVRDEGLGIQSRDLARIFDRFERAGIQDNISGLGLGLYLVKQIVEAHGGQVEVTSQPREGSTFLVRLPAA